MLYNFLIKNITISILLIIFMVILVLFELNELIQSKNSINSKRAVDLINHKNAKIIDFRTEDHFKQCHIIDSINIPYTNFKKYNNKIKRYKRKTIIIIHYKNRLAQNLIKELKILDINDAIYIKDGIEAWKKDNLPTTSIKKY